ncbi:phosphodiester glycosidase family protein [Paenibacillus tarimensis]|uniref:phosphodiester glycosidase family protein n=1 Tax=Paenibacillus tarimensis TaxID=416012 RepID=UPI001F366EE6|nr:phosphodiester glycosidase family protein [Paenibacillus tarimensis]MCF2944049.1 phosphodiester glycosidase family protein [Paenibacillus tarimensis]
MKPIRSQIIVWTVVMSLLLGALPASAGTKMYGYNDQKANRTFVPIRFISEQTGAKVQWNSKDGKVTIIKDTKVITFFVDKPQAMVDDKKVTLDDKPFREEGVVYAPLKFICQSLGLSAKMDSATSSLFITYEGDTYKLPVINKGVKVSSGEPIKHAKRSFRVGGSSMSVDIVTVTLLHPSIDLSVGIAGGAVGRVEELKTLASRHKAVVAMNGTFFDAYSDASFKTPYGYIVNNGEIKKKSSGDRKTVFLFDEMNRAEMVAGLSFPERYEQGDVDGALQVGPRLVTNGKITLNVKEEGFRDPKILTGGGARSAIGLTRDHKLLLVTSKGATIPQMASIMKQAGAYQAMNMDGGASSGLYYKGSYITTPGRKISNALLITQSR